MTSEQRLPKFKVLSRDVTVVRSDSKVSSDIWGWNMVCTCWFGCVSELGRLTASNEVAKKS